MNKFKVITEEEDQALDANTDLAQEYVTNLYDEGVRYMKHESGIYLLEPDKEGKIELVPSANAPSLKGTEAIHMLGMLAEMTAFNVNDRIIDLNIPNTPNSKRNYLLQPKTTPLYAVGRNDTCPCGSGKKFKKCCINKTKED